MIIAALLMILVNFILYTGFGSLLAVGKKNAALKGCDRLAVCLLGGFFLYYSLFTLFAVPVTYRWRPLSLLSQLWCGAVVVVMLLSIIIAGRIWKENFNYIRSFLASNRRFVIILGLMLIAQILVVLYSYQFTLDAAYYVANVTTSLQTNSLNIYDPYTGDWQNHFEMRYFFATYPLQDAVMCYVTKVPALVQTKGVMTVVVLLMTNLLYVLIAREFFEGKFLSTKYSYILWAVFFAGIINFCFITIYTSSNFLLTRTYEGKSILGNIILPAILYLYIKILKSEKKTIYYAVLFIVCFGSTVISNSANMLVPAALAVLFIPYIIRLLAERRIKQASIVFGIMLACMLPGIILMLVYVAYVKGKFILYTYPR